MEILPSQLIQCIAWFRPLLRVEVFETFALLLTGLLVGQAKHGTVRASVFASSDYQPARISDFFTRHRVSPQALMAKLIEILLRLLYGGKLPERLFWIGDSTQTEKPYAEKIAALGLFHRAKRVVGQAKHLKGHCYVCAAHLYQYLDSDGRLRWASALVGAWLYVKGSSIPVLLGRLAAQLRLPAGIRHVWIVDRGILARTLLRALEALGAIRVRSPPLESSGLLRADCATTARAQENLRRERPRGRVAQAFSSPPARSMLQTAGARQTACG